MPETPMKLKPLTPQQGTRKPAQPQQGTRKPAQPQQSVRKPAQPQQSVRKPAQPQESVRKPAKPQPEPHKPAPQERSEELPQLKRNPNAPVSRKPALMRRLKANAYVFVFLLVFLGASFVVYPKLWKAHAGVKAEPSAAEQTPAETTSDAAPADETAAEDAEEAADEEDADEVPEDAPAVFVTSDTSYFDDALIIGDSRTVGLCNYGDLGDATFFCSVGLSALGTNGGEKLDGMTVFDLMEENEYGKVYIMLGMNEVGAGLDQFKENITKLYNSVRECEPDALIFMMANLHVTAKTSKERPEISNDVLNKANGYMEELTDGRKSFYIDVNTLFDDENHCLTASYSADGIHVGGDEYTRWAEWLCTQTITDASFPQNQLSFTDALAELRDGKTVSRAAWGNSMELRLITPEPETDDEAELTPYIALKTSDNRLTPWTPKQADLLTRDWMVLE